jgi:hypothetical protein
VIPQFQSVHYQECSYSGAQQDSEHDSIVARPTNNYGNGELSSTDVVDKSGQNCQRCCEKGTSQCQQNTMSLCRASIQSNGRTNDYRPHKKPNEECHLWSGPVRSPEDADKQNRRDQRQNAKAPLGDSITQGIAGAIHSGDGIRWLSITLEITGNGRTTCKQTRTRTTRSPVHFVVRQLDCLAPRFSSRTIGPTLPDVSCHVWQCNRQRLLSSGRPAGGLHPSMGSSSRR